MEDIKIPKHSIEYILFQRTGYLNKNILNQILTYIGFFQPLHLLSIKLKSKLFSKEITEEFNKDMIEEYKSIMLFLPKQISSFLDIGCGVGGIDVLVSAHYNNKVDLFLLDKTDTDKQIYYGFKKRGSFYNSLDITKELLVLNGTNPNKIHTQEVTSDYKINFGERFDLVISLLSWGHHYPVLIYLDQVYESLKPNGILILDIRNNTGGEKELERRFDKYTKIFENQKFSRLLLQK